MAETQTKAPEDRLIERYVDLDADRYAHGRADARLRDYGTPIWALVSHLGAVGGTSTRSPVTTSCP